jgi:hypothetical protein
MGKWNERHIWRMTILAVLSVVGCNGPTEHLPQTRSLEFWATGDLPLYVEYSYELAAGRKQEGVITIDSTMGIVAFHENNSAYQGSTFRVYAFSKGSKGHVYARVRAYTGSSWTSDYRQWFYQEKEEWGIPVEITGKVP